MRNALGILGAVAVLSLVVASAAAPALAYLPGEPNGSVCYSFAASVPGATLDPETGYLPGLAYNVVYWPGSAAQYPYVVTEVYSASIAVLATSSVVFSIPGDFALIQIANATPYIGGTAYYFVCFY